MSTSDPNPENPYADNLADAEPTTKSDAQDQSVFAEPWMQKTHFERDQYSDAAVPVPNPNDVEHTVWDEPALAPELSGETPEDALTWTNWYLRREAETTVLDTWLVTLLLMVLAGPLALVTSWFGFGGSTFDIVILIVLIPAAEELLKVMLPLWVVEKRPYLFCAPFQILLCTFCSGLIFGGLRYVFEVKLFGPMSMATISTVAGGPILSIAVHGVTSLIAGFAHVRIWREAAVHHRRPNLTHGASFGGVAIAVHVVYAIVAVIIAMTG